MKKISQKDLEKMSDDGWAVDARGKSLILNNRTLKRLETNLAMLSESIKQPDGGGVVAALNKTHDALTSLLQEIITRVLPSLVALKSKPKYPTWVFTVKRDGKGLIKKITAKPKE